MHWLVRWSVCWRWMRMLGADSVKREGSSCCGNSDPEAICRRRLAAYEEVQRMGPRDPLPPDDWLRLACEPGQASESDSLDFLDHLPLRSLVGHGARRALRKLLT